MTKTALITGITGQDGSYLAELLLEKGYRVFGFGRKSSIIRAHYAGHLHGRLEYLYGDLIDTVSMVAAIQNCRPDEIYNLASQSAPRRVVESGDRDR